MTQTQTKRLPSLRFGPPQLSAFCVKGSDKFRRSDPKQVENEQAWLVVLAVWGSLPPLPMGAPTHSRCVILKGLQPPWYLGQREVRGPQLTVCPACRGTASLASRELPPCPRPALPMHWVLDLVGTGPQLPPSQAPRPM